MLYLVLLFKLQLKKERKKVIIHWETEESRQTEERIKNLESELAELQKEGTVPSALTKIQTSRNFLATKSYSDLPQRVTLKPPKPKTPFSLYITYPHVNTEQLIGRKVCDRGGPDPKYKGEKFRNPGGWRYGCATSKILSTYPYSTDIFMDKIDRERLELRKQQEAMKGHENWKYTCPCTRMIQKDTFSPNYQHYGINY